MPINFGNTGPRFPFLRYKPKVDEWQVPGDEGPQPIEIVGKPIAFDVENGVKGWLTIETGRREWIPIPGPVNEPPPLAPNREAKVGFSLFAFAPKLFGDDRAYEACNNSFAWTIFIGKLFKQCEPRFGKGEIPVITITDVKPVKTGQGTSRDIKFTVDKWIARPQPVIDALAERDADSANRAANGADYAAAKGKASPPASGSVTSGKPPSKYNDLDDDDIPFAHAVPREFQKDVEHPLTGVQFK